MATRDWDADTYERVSDPQFEWGLEVLDRLHLRGDERLLDAGCGTGRVTAEAARRLPHGLVIAVDGSAAMVESARGALSDRVELRVADLLELSLDPPVDAVLSTAVFHWISDHGRLFDRLYACLRPGGRLEAQCGGEGNIDNLRAAVEEVTAAPEFAAAADARPWRFAAAEETQTLLEHSGFAAVRCWLERRVARPADPRAFLETVTLGPHLERLGPDMHDRFLDAVMERMGEPFELHYVRLNIAARRP